MPTTDYNQNVFLNCPFDKSYRRMLRAVVFTVFDCGFVPRSALELLDTGEVRVDKIRRIIGECRYGFHDISRTGLYGEYRLPRFNMPFELGLSLGMKAPRQRCLVVDREPYRYQRFLSDIAGQDVEAHGNNPRRVVAVVRNWLSSGRRVAIPGGTHIWKRYVELTRALPRIARGVDLTPSELTFNDYSNLVSAWLEEYGTF